MVRGSFLGGGGRGVGTEFQTVGALNLKERWPKDLVFVLGTERSPSLFDLRDREGS